MRLLVPQNFYYNFESVKRLISLKQRELRMAIKPYNAKFSLGDRKYGLYSVLKYT